MNGPTIQIPDSFIRADDFLKELDEKLAAAIAKNLRNCRHPGNPIMTRVSSPVPGIVFQCHICGKPTKFLPDDMSERVVEVERIVRERVEVKRPIGKEELLLMGGLLFLILLIFANAVLYVYLTR